MVLLCDNPILGKEIESCNNIHANKNIVCNIGDMMQLVTRNQLKSTTHRVMDYQEKNPKSRYSIPFFLHPSPNVTLQSIVDDSPESISAHDFLEERIRAIGLY